MAGFTTTIARRGGRTIWGFRQFPGGVLIYQYMDCNIFEVWEKYKDGLYGFVHKRVNEEEDAKDIQRDVLEKSNTNDKSQLVTI